MQRQRVKRLSISEFSSLSQKQVRLLEEAGLTDIPQIAGIHEQELKSILDTTINKVRAIIAQARSSLPDFLVQSLKDMEEDEDKRFHLSSGSRAIDGLLGGKGFESGSISEVSAEFAAGKSQLAMTMAARACHSNINGCVLIVDTEGTWKTSRLKEIASYIDGVSSEDLENKIRIIRPLSSSEQSLVLKKLLEDEGTKLGAYLKTELPLKLLVVDSLTGLYRAEYPGRGALAERQHLLSEHLKNLYLLARRYNAIVLVTNQVIHNPDIYAPGGPMRAVGGNIVGHACTIRMMIRKKSGVVRYLQMVDSAHLPMGEVPFILGPKGVEDVDED